MKYLFNVEAVFFSRDFSQDIIRRLEIEFISDLTKSYVSSACIISYSKRFQTLYSCTQRKRVLFEDVKKQLSKNWKISCRWSVLPSCLFNWRGFEYQTQETVEVLWFCSLESLLFLLLLFLPVLQNQDLEPNIGKKSFGNRFFSAVRPQLQHYVSTNCSLIITVKHIFLFSQWLMVRTTLQNSTTKRNLYSTVRYIISVSFWKESQMFKTQNLGRNYSEFTSDSRKDTSKN